MTLLDIFYTADRIYVVISMIVITIGIVTYYQKHFSKKKEVKK